MSYRFTSFLLLTLLAAGCHKQAVSGSFDKALSGQKSPKLPLWTTHEHKDAMTDVVTYSITTSSTDGTGSFNVACFPENNTFGFQSDLFLGKNAYGDVEYRFDDEKPSTARALLVEQVAITGAPVNIAQAIKAGGDRFMTALNGFEFGTEMTTKAHKRLRIRLHSFDGSTKDLDINMTGAIEQINKLYADCHSK